MGDVGSEGGSRGRGYIFICNYMYMYIYACICIYICVYVHIYVYVCLWLIHIIVRQKTTQYCKAIILQLKFFKKI